MSHTYDLDTGAWIQDPTDGWVSSKVASKNIRGDKVTLAFEITSGAREGEVRFLSTAWTILLLQPVRGNRVVDNRDRK
jgi:hypothetical protein